ncbi:TrkH family potassium uptake protein [Draconibacterium sediminis]|uniref:TrkH family potassium uptake protein n=1 Tax=Draconibacterium sediminis TaxID=1544798 RepID=UPI0026F143FC|nr:TrkH family potassium uptake protein [Draconibacterium sediminis]
MLKTIFKQIGSLLKVLGIVEMIPSLVAVIYGEWYSAAGFIVSGAIIFCIGVSLNLLFKDAEEPRQTQALVIASSAWLILTFLGGLPFYVIARITPLEVMNNFIPTNAGYDVSSLIYFKKPIHCFFESMSAYTTTGLTMTVHESSVGKGVLFYRHFAQWVGGAGFVVMVLAIFKQRSDRSALLLFGSESSIEKLKPRIIETARAIWKVYLILTIFSAIYLIIGTYLILPDYPLSENVFDSINHAMAGQSTGGFSTLDDSIAGYNSAKMEMLYLLPMILGAFSIPFFYKVIFLRKFNEFWKDAQTRSLIFAFVAGSAIQSFLLFKSQIVPTPVREGVFQFISAMSTTGWQTSNIGTWDWKSVLFMVAFAMFIGGASGATVGGIKMIRAIVIKKEVMWQISKTFFSENTVRKIKLNQKSLLPEEMNDEFSKAASLAILFFVFIIVSAFVATLFTSERFSFADSLMESTSAQATVGLSSGISDPSMSPVLELIYIFQMWAGRLEIIPIFALFRALLHGLPFPIFKKMNIL